MFLIPIWTEVTIWKIINRLSKLFKFFLLSNLWARKNMNEASSEFRRLRNAVASEVRRIPEGIMSIICGHRSCDDLWSQYPITFSPRSAISAYHQSVTQEPLVVYTVAQVSALEAAVSASLLALRLATGLVEQSIAMPLDRPAPPYPFDRFLYRLQKKEEWMSSLKIKTPGKTFLLLSCRRHIQWL